MSLTTTIIVNALLWVFLIGALVFLLGYGGVRKTVPEEKDRLRRHHRLRSQLR
jgi:hypothetical protein